MQYRAIINTILSITASTASAAITARILENGKLEGEVILNATLAG